MKSALIVLGVFPIEPVRVFVMKIVNFAQYQQTVSHSVIRINAVYSRKHCDRMSLVHLVTDVPAQLAVHYET